MRAARAGRRRSAIIRAGARPWRRGKEAIAKIADFAAAYGIDS